MCLKYLHSESLRGGEEHVWGPAGVHRGIPGGEESFCLDVNWKVTLMIWNEEGPVYQPQSSTALGVAAHVHGQGSGLLAS